jgi:hypothetical protein
MSALEIANRTRMEKSRLKTRINLGELEVSDAIWQADFPNMTMGELLGAQHRWGYQKVRRLCHAAGVTETKRIGTLTDRQRKAICDLLGQGR